MCTAFLESIRDMRWTGLVIVLGIVLSASHHSAGAKLSRPREKRFAQQGCQMNPPNSEDDVIEEGASVTLECSFDSEPQVGIVWRWFTVSYMFVNPDCSTQSCMWSHNEPMNGDNSAIDPDVSCSGSPGENGEYCEDDQRIQFQFSSGKCGIVIQTTKPEDTGVWRLSAVGRGTSGSAQVTLLLFSGSQGQPFWLP